MQKNFALLLIAFIVFFEFVPAYYAPDDEALRQNSSLSDVYSQLFTSTGTFSDIIHTQAWTGVSLSWNISYILPQYVPSSSATRAPPA